MPKPEPLTLNQFIEYLEIAKELLEAEGDINPDDILVQCYGIDGNLSPMYPEHIKLAIDSVLLDIIDVEPRQQVNFEGKMKTLGRWAVFLLLSDNPTREEREKTEHLRDFINNLIYRDFGNMLWQDQLDRLTSYTDGITSNVQQSMQELILLLGDNYTHRRKTEKIQEVLKNLVLITESLESLRNRILPPSEGF